VGQPRRHELPGDDQDDGGQELLDQPWATLYAAVLGEIDKKEKDPRFKKTDSGQVARAASRLAELSHARSKSTTSHPKYLRPTLAVRIPREQKVG
jgi:hypothetical protein